MFIVNLFTIYKLNLNKLLFFCICIAVFIIKEYTSIVYNKFAKHDILLTRYTVYIEYMYRVSHNFAQIGKINVLLMFHNAFEVMLLMALG